jgi:hypothetical protein
MPGLGKEYAEHAAVEIELSPFIADSHIYGLIRLPWIDKATCNAEGV